MNFFRLVIFVAIAVPLLSSPATFAAGKDVRERVGKDELLDPADLVFQEHSGVTFRGYAVRIKNKNYFDSSGMSKNQVAVHYKYFASLIAAAKSNGCKVRYVPFSKKARVNGVSYGGDGMMNSWDLGFTFDLAEETCRVKFTHSSDFGIDLIDPDSLSFGVDKEKYLNVMANGKPVISLLYTVFSEFGAEGYSLSKAYLNGIKEEAKKRNCKIRIRTAPGFDRVSNTANAMNGLYATVSMAEYTCKNSRVNGSTWSNTNKPLSGTAAE